MEQEIWRGDLATISQRFLNRLGGQLKVTYLGDNKYNIGVTNGNYYWKRIAVCNPLPPLKTGEIPYDAVAQKIIDMANAEVSAGDEAGLKQKAMAEAYVGEVADEIATQAMKEAEWERTKELIDDKNKDYRIYNRQKSPTQTDEDLDKQIKSNMLCGMGARQIGSGYSDLLAVKAYIGALPENTAGIEFMTNIKPTNVIPNHAAFWYLGTVGVIPLGEDLACIPVIITKAQK